MDLSPTPQRQEVGALIFDFVMVLLLCANILLIVFDSIFGSTLVQEALLTYQPDFYHYYNTHIDDNLFYYDLMFIGAFLVEFLIRWGISIYQKEYERWFFYPILHFYDLLGCIPLDAFRLLRFLRIIVLVARLQRLGVIRLQNTGIYRAFRRYYNIVIEEVSDRVVLNVLEEAKKEVRQGNEMVNKILREVLLPNREILLEWISRKIAHTAAHAGQLYQDDLRRYVDNLIRQAMQQSSDVEDLHRIPVAGQLITQKLERAVADIVFHVIRLGIQDLSSTQNKQVVAELGTVLSDLLLTPEDNQQLRQMAVNIAVQAIDLIKEQVEVKQWKLRESENS